MGLEHANAVVIVHNEAGQPVPFPVHQTVAIGALILRQAVGFPELIGPQEHPLPEIRQRRVFVKAENTHGDGANLVMPAGQQLAVCRAYAHEVSLCGMAHYLGDGPGEHPGMIAQQGFLPAGFEDDFIHCLEIFRGKVVPA